MPVPEHLAAAICPHGVELDMCDTWGCAQEYNRLAEEHAANDRPRRLWRYPARDLTRPWAAQAFRATDEFHNPTIAVGLPGLGMWVLAYPRRLNTALCNEGDCQEPTCEVAAFYRQQQ